MVGIESRRLLGSHQRTASKHRLIRVGDWPTAELLCGLVLGCCLWGQMLDAEGDEPALSPSHLEFIAGWFPDNAAAAVHLEAAAVTELATRLMATPSRFASTLTVLDLIRDHVGIDYAEIERVTTATIVADVPGTVVFFTLSGDGIVLEEHLSSGHAPVRALPDRFHQHVIHKLNAGKRPMGLYSGEGKHFILGDWGAFKTTLAGRGDRRNELTKILTIHTAPIILCKNPRKQGQRYAKDDPFGTVVSIDFDKDQLAVLMQEEQPTPDMAVERHSVMQEEMPKLFESKYGLTTKKGVRFQSRADGRNVKFYGLAPLSESKCLLESLLGELKPSDAGELADTTADQALELYRAARAAGAECSGLSSEEAVVAALCAGLQGKAGARFKLPFLTAPERQRVAQRLLLESGELGLAPVVEEPAALAPSADEQQIRRHARLIATLSSSAAAHDSPQLKKLETTEEIIAAICTTGLSSGPGTRKRSSNGLNSRAPNKIRSPNS